MKNFINYYYNLYIENFKKIENKFKFVIDNVEYEFIPFYGDLNNLYKIYSILKKIRLYCHEIIINRDNSIFTIYENIPYLLIRIDISINKYVDVHEIFNYDVSINSNSLFNWKQLWEEKIDYYEYQMSQISSKYPILKQSFNYYVGLTETAIALLNYVDEKNISYSICHRRITYKEKLYQFFNPTEIIIDNRTRDIAEYIKINYINDNIRLDEVYSIIEYSNLSNEEAILFLCRLLYPSYYFDLYDKIIQNKINEEKISVFIKKNADYELFLKSIYLSLRKKHSIPEIEWLI